MCADKRISAVIPCHNEEQGLEILLKQKPDFIDEVIVVNDHSTDRTVEVAFLYSAKVVSSQKRGYIPVYTAGINKASGI